MLAEGRVSLAPPLVPPVPWPDAGATFAPSGFAPGPGPDGGSVPLCPAGLSVAMAAAVHIAGDAAVFAVVPLMGLLAVWCTWLLGRRLAGPGVGAASAMLLACSPTFLYQLVQPMSDVPAAALWTAALAIAIGPEPRARATAARGLAAGLLTGAAIMMRPNLAPLAAIPLLLVWPSRICRPRGGRRRDARSRRGGPPPGGHLRLASAIRLRGPGPALQPRLRRHQHRQLPGMARLRAHAGAGTRGIAPLVAARRTVAWALLAFAAGVLAAYLPYVPFADWWYTRFVLPALPALIILTMTLLERAASRLPSRAGLAALAVGTMVLGAYWLGRADELAVFRLKALEQKYVELGRLASSRLPRNAIVLAAQPAGSVRYYARLPTLSWDAIDAAWLDRVFAECRARGLVPYLAVEAWEMEAFRSRFRGHSPAADLDWPPRATLGHVIFVYDPADRDRYLAGERIHTERITWESR